jgi:predicted lysophospholipase L1 biosynthesis ABC-type transport system permease subunit
VVNKPMREVVGVVGNVKIEGIITPQSPHYFLPFEQAVITSPPVAIRTAGDPLSLIGPLRAAIAGMDRDVPLYRIRTLDDLVYRAAAQPRFQTLLLSSFATLALLLAAVGLYGMLAYMVVQRTPEIGIRMAIGAQRSDVVRLILGRGMKLAAVGAALGLIGALFVTEFLQNLLYEVQPLDTATFAIVTAVLLAVSLLAGIAPALRASRLDPMSVLRDS